MTNLDSFFFIWSNLLLSTFYKSIPELGNYKMATKGRNFSKKKKAFTSLSCMGCFIQTHHSSQLTLLNEQEERMRELVDKLHAFFLGVTKGEF